MTTRLVSENPDDLVQAERDVRARIGDQPFDFEAMAAISNIYRAANVVRNHMEQKVLADYDLSWGAFTVMFVLWIWGEQQARDLAAEAGVTKGTLTGILKTLESRRFVQRRPHGGDGRRVMVRLEAAGRRAIEDLFPRFNEQEAFASSGLSAEQRRELASYLRVLIRTVGGPGARDADDRAHADAHDTATTMSADGDTAATMSADGGTATISGIGSASR